MRRRYTPVQRPKEPNEGLGKEIDLDARIPLYGLPRPRFVNVQVDQIQAFVGWRRPSPQQIGNSAPFPNGLLGLFVGLVVLPEIRLDIFEP